MSGKQSSLNTIITQASQPANPLQTTPLDDRSNNNPKTGCRQTCRVSRSANVNVSTFSLWTSRRGALIYLQAISLTPISWSLSIRALLNLLGLGCRVIRSLSCVGTHGRAPKWMWTESHLLLWKVWSHFNWRWYSKWGSVLTLEYFSF